MPASRRCSTWTKRRDTRKTARGRLSSRSMASPSRRRRRASAARCRKFASRIRCSRPRARQCWAAGVSTAIGFRRFDEPAAAAPATIRVSPRVNSRVNSSGKPNAARQILPAPLQRERARHARHALAALSEELLERRGVEQFDGAPLHLDQALLMKAGKEPAYGFKLQPEIAADFLAGHAQHKLGRRVAAFAIPLRQVEKERRKPFFGAHAAERQHGVLGTANLPRQSLVEVALKRCDAAR